MIDPVVAKIQANPKYQELRDKRGAFGWWLALAMMVNQVVAALGGVLVPLTLDRMGLDPALASGTFVTTLTDVMGFFAFLGLATVMLT